MDWVRLSTPFEGCEETFFLCLSVPIEGGISYRRGASSNLEGGAVLLLLSNLGGHCVPVVTSE